MAKTISFEQAGKLGTAVVGKISTAQFWTVLRQRRIGGMTSEQAYDFTTMAVLSNQLGSKAKAAQFCAAIESTLSA